MMTWTAGKRGRLDRLGGLVVSDRRYESRLRLKAEVHLIFVVEVIAEHFDPFENGPFVAFVPVGVPYCDCHDEKVQDMLLSPTYETRWPPAFKPMPKIPAAMPKVKRSPTEVRREELSSYEGAVLTHVADNSDFGAKMQIYANNMRKLIIAARAEVNSLMQQNTVLKRKIESGGLVECPACLLRFKPKKEQKILPKYIKVLRGRLSLEIEFSTLGEMSHWLVANQLDLNSDGLSTMVQSKEKEKNDLTAAGSPLPSLLNFEEKTELKKERLVISTHPRKEESNSGTKFNNFEKVSKVHDTNLRSHSTWFFAETAKKCQSQGNNHRHNDEGRKENKSASTVPAREGLFYHRKSGEFEVEGKWTRKKKFWPKRRLAALCPGAVCL
ncbi:hypothetical protein Y032_0002g793 [Ancylostoma ceylanicum]|uniref:Uncharacterized protein n=1 Tax=Ancylostoma ceylanicum TaxID=53326 RepID=A0A016W0P1_9BILA|nr:hypothetical protein Y032_0002g793 [Ancylostoma ceylanicum]